MGKRYSEREMKLPPSQRKYAQHMKAPEGCVDVWRINAVGTGGQMMINSQWFDRAKCMKKADELWAESITNSRHKSILHVYVEHKAAIMIDGKYHIVNIPSFTPADDLDTNYLHDSVVTTSKVLKNADPDPDHKKWLAEFDGEARVHQEQVRGR